MEVDFYDCDVMKRNKEGNEKIICFYGGFKMKNKLTLKDLSNLSEKILERSKENYGNAILLSQDNCRKYETKFLKNMISKGFNTYQEIICLMKFPHGYLSSVNYDVCESMKTKKIVDSVCNQVTLKIDSQKWMIRFYYCLQNVGIKLTEQEAIYLTSAFQKHKTEENIADDLNISLSSVKKIKKSCLIKTWIEIQSLIEECEKHSFFY